MQSEVEKLVKRLKSEMDLISDYVEGGFYEEANQSEIIKYSEINLLQKVEKSSIKKLIEYDHGSAIKAKIQKDFIEFCRYICLQLELLLSYIYRHDTEVSTSLTSRFYNFANKKSIVFCPIRTKNVISNAIKIRNIASHRDIIAPANIRIKRQGNVAHLHINNLEPNREIDVREVREKLQIVCGDIKWNTAKVNISRKYGNCRAYVDISCIDLELTPNDVRNDIRQRIREVYEIFGRNVQVEFNSDKQPDSNELNKNNELNQFFLDSNYEELIEALLWFIKAFEQHCSR